MQVCYAILTPFAMQSALTASCIQAPDLQWVFQHALYHSMSDEKKSDNISKSGYWSAAVLNTKVKVKHDIWMKMLKVDNYLVRRSSCTIGCWCEEILLQIIPLSSQHVLLKTSGRESSRRFVPNQLLCQACPLEADSVFLLRFFYFQPNAKMVKIGTTSGRAVGIAQIWPKNSPLGSQTLTWKVTSGYGGDHSSSKEEDDLILAEDLF